MRNIYRKTQEMVIGKRVWKRARKTQRWKRLRQLWRSRSEKLLLLTQRIWKIWHYISLRQSSSSSRSCSCLLWTSLVGISLVREDHIRKCALDFFVNIWIPGSLGNLGKLFISLLGDLSLQARLSLPTKLLKAFLAIPSLRKSYAY